MTGIATSMASANIDTHGRATDQDRAARGFHSVERNWQAHDRRVPGALGDRLAAGTLRTAHPMTDGGNFFAQYLEPGMTFQHLASVRGTVTNPNHHFFRHIAIYLLTRQVNNFPFPGRPRPRPCVTPATTIAAITAAGEEQGRSRRADRPSRL